MAASQPMTVWAMHRKPFGIVVFMTMWISLANELASVIMQRNCHTVFERPTRAEAQAEVINRVLCESPIEQIRMFAIQSLEFKIQGGIYDHRQFFRRLLGRFFRRF